MEIYINDIELLLPKKVPKHGKVSGIKSKRASVRVIIPKKNTKLSLKVSEPSEILLRNVTPDGKILGLSNFIGENIFIIDQNEEDLHNETGTVPLIFEDHEKDINALKRLFELCEKKNLDPIDMLDKMMAEVEKSSHMGGGE